jgi:hypothetical protein
MSSDQCTLVSDVAPALFNAVVHVQKFLVDKQQILQLGISAARAANTIQVREVHSRQAIRYRNPDQVVLEEDLCRIGVRDFHVSVSGTSVPGSGE